MAADDLEKVEYYRTSRMRDYLNEEDAIGVQEHEDFDELFTMNGLEFDIDEINKLIAIVPDMVRIILDHEDYRGRNGLPNRGEPPLPEVKPPR